MTSTSVPPAPGANTHVAGGDRKLKGRANLSRGSAEDIARKLLYPNAGRSNGEGGVGQSKDENDEGEPSSTISSHPEPGTYGDADAPSPGPPTSTDIPETATAPNAQNAVEAKPWLDPSLVDPALRGDMDVDVDG